MQLTELAMFTEDVEATADFWSSLLDVEPHVRHEGIAIFDADGVTVLIHETYEPGPDDLPPEDHMAFAVDDVDSAYAELVDAGLESFREPDDYDWGRSAYLTDPDGRLVELSA